MVDAGELLNTLIASEIRADLLTLFRKNPGIMDSLDGVARRIGLPADAVRDDVSELVKLGVLATMNFGSYQVIYLDRKKDKEIQKAVGNYLQTLKSTKES